MGSNEGVLADFRNDNETSCCLDNELFKNASSGERNKHLQLAEQTQPVRKHYVKETVMDNLKEPRHCPSYNVHNVYNTVDMNIIFKK
jgi:hypothetical protein